MTSATTESLMKEAINAVLTRLGESMFILLKLNLAQEYKIYIDNNETYTLEELHVALQKIVGPGGGSLLVREINKEIELLSSQQIR